MCDPILVNLLKIWPHYSQSSRENATPSSGTSSLASYREVLLTVGVAVVGADELKCPFERNYGPKDVIKYGRRRANAHDSAVSLTIFLSFLTASQEHITLPISRFLVLKWNATLFNDVSMSQERVTYLS